MRKSLGENQFSLRRVDITRYALALVSNSYIGLAPYTHVLDDRVSASRITLVPNKEDDLAWTGATSNHCNDSSIH